MRKQQTMIPDLTNLFAKAPEALDWIPRTAREP
jgi:hypothetical protein